MSILTVTTAASDLSLLSAAALREAAGLDPTDASQDAALAIVGDRVAATIARACNVPVDGATPPTLRLETLSETFRPDRCLPTLVLARRPVGAIASVTVDGTALASTGYEVEKAAALLYRLSNDCRIDWSASKVVVAYTAGWSVVPPDLALAATKLVQTIRAEGRRSDPNLRQETIEGVGSWSYWVSPRDDPALPQEVLDLLAPYRNHPVG